MSQTLAARHIRYYEIIKKPVERLGYSHTWGGSDGRLFRVGQPKPGFSKLPNIERWPRPIAWPDLLSSHRYKRVHPEFIMAAVAEDLLSVMAQCRPQWSLFSSEVFLQQRSTCEMKVVMRRSNLFSYFTDFLAVSTSFIAIHYIPHGGDICAVLSQYIQFWAP